jgi:hypothetical protein
VSSTDYEFQTSFKTNGGTLINIPAKTPDEAKAKMEHLQALAPVIAATENVLNGNSNAASMAAPPAQQTYQAPPQQAPPPPNDDPWASAPNAASAPAQSGGRQCPHGSYVWKEGVSRSTNKPYKGWFCPGRGTDCKPDFVN